MRKDSLVWLVLIVSLVAFVWLGVLAVRIWNTSQAGQLKTGPGLAGTLSAGATATAESGQAYLPLAQLTRTVESGVTAWDAAPPCSNQPLDENAWAAAAPQSRALLSPGGAVAQTPGYGYQALLLNLASGRLNRATKIRLEEFPEVQTVGDLLARIEAGGDVPQASLLQTGPDETYAAAIEAVNRGAAVTQPVCARLALLTDGAPAGALDWTGSQEPGVQTGQLAVAQMPSGQLAAANPDQARLDAGLASPDGVWAAYTSLNVDAGGPVFVQNLQTGAWTNLIALMNKVRAPEQPELLENDWWTVVDWFPDSRRLMIARSDASSAVVVDTQSGEWQVYPFPGDGNGGAPVLDLAPDGSQFVFIGVDADGRQTISLFHFDSGKAADLLARPMTEGVSYFPRFSPDGGRIAYLYQQGDPLNGLVHTIHLLSLTEWADQRVWNDRELVPGNVGFTVPAWSPDGEFIAFVRPDAGLPQRVVEGQEPQRQAENVWVVRLSDGALQQLTALPGQVRSPKWSNDSRTLAFVNENGQVGMVSLNAPGRVWAVSGPAEFPLMTSVFFVP